MSAIGKSNGSGGAYFEVSGEVANNSTWQENIYFMEAGAQMELTGLSFKMTLRCQPSDSTADYTLSTTDGTLSIVEDTDTGVSNILYINVPVGSLTGLCGDYVADLASEDQNGVVSPWAHGVISFRPNPVTF